jgi:indolepyruvate ferredoxin oxidoreductase
MERKLRDDYLVRLEKLAAGLTAENHALAVEIASLPDEIRGYGHVKDKSVHVAEQRLASLMARWQTPSPRTPAMAAE